MRKTYLLLGLCLGMCQITWAQTPNDALMMPKQQLCVLGQYTHSSWDQYWQGETKRSNANIGTFTNQSALLMGAYGITDRLNALIGLPYIWTGSDSYLQGEHNIQDLSVFLKYQLWNKTALGGQFKILITGGASTPVSHYVADFLPFSIGIQSKTASLRGILNYTANMGLYVTAQSGHTWRANADIDRDAYLFDNKLYYGSTVPVPNVFDGSLRLGYIRNRIQTEFWMEHSTGLSGDDIRYNDAPFPSNKMQWTAVGWFGKYFLTERFALQVSYSQVLNGRNVGQSTTLAGGATYIFSVGKPK